ncbi:amino acid ABC transporter permease [Ancylobacter sp. MQZ15Z-1]|uniref:Amino acid ABC transporter permease n=1 Tax=Ancylobacter mangrovi TaxID=2972472 RepID=A0A9X2T6Y2_9HYPH|nr:amino acid ABC transporter permease [Ancylobacter mangrovi]MCS0496914.1 amino acid ABC transporter permease [Ancylobacter mangrovi]
MHVIFVNQEILAQGLVMTLALTFCVLIAATAVATILAAGMLSRSALLRVPARILVEIMRDIPLFVTVMMIYFVAPTIGIALDPFEATVAGLGAWGGANGAIIIRAGIQAVSSGQREACAALGLHRFQALRLVILPQALRPILPPYLGLVTQLVQATSIGALIGVRELLRSAQIVIERATIMEGGLSPFTLYAAVLVVYFVICFALSLASARMEAVLSRHEQPSSSAKPRLSRLRLMPRG